MVLLTLLNLHYSNDSLRVSKRCACVFQIGQALRTGQCMMPVWKLLRILVAHQSNHYEPNRNTNQISDNCFFGIFCVKFCWLHIYSSRSEIESQQSPGRAPGQPAISRRSLTKNELENQFHTKEHTSDFLWNKGRHRQKFPGKRKECLLEPQQAKRPIRIGGIRWPRPTI